MSDIVERLFNTDIENINSHMICEAREEIARLRAENDASLSLWAELKSLRDTLRAENEKLREVLKPFARAARYYWSYTNDDYLISDDTELTMGDLRAAAAAIRESGDE